MIREIQASINCHKFLYFFFIWFLLQVFATLFQVSKLEDELATKNQAFKMLEEKIKSQEDYEEIKRELR